MNISSGGTLRKAAVVGVVLLLVGSMGVGISATAGERFSEESVPGLLATIDGTNTVTPGETTTMTLAVQNRHDGITNSDRAIEDVSRVIQAHGVQVGAASGTTVTYRDDGLPIDVKTGTQSIGTVPSGGATQVPLTVEISESADPGTYTVPMEVEFSYIRGIFVDRDDYTVKRNTATTETSVTIRVEKDGRLEIVDTRGDGLYKNAEGDVAVTVRNAGSETMSDTTLSLVGSTHFEPQSNGIALDTVAPGETRNATFETIVRGVESAGSYAVGFRTDYEDANGQLSKSTVRYGGVAVAGGPQYEISVEPRSLYVDSTGAARITVTNTGDVAATNARVFAEPNQPFAPLSNGGQLGALGPGESATTSVKLEVSDRALAQSYALPIVVAHDDTYGNVVRSDPLTADIDVGPERQFDVVNTARIEAGATEQIELTVENTGESSFEDAVIRINADSPFETDDDTAYVGELAPGEQVTVSYTVSVGEAATPKAYTLDTTIKYDNLFDETVVSDVRPATVEVTEPSGPSIPFVLTAIGVPMLLVGGIVYKRDRLRRFF
ncbi:COG1361 S-layer family protein [Halorubrum yunnanense]|uniref:COG1361 S-layer family protein n=1 Tax=Halorubrum yunnanense TaxID=1526162 RepID=A0ABD5YA87_9EURY|nr:NEW3 domain-containing protein [Halorubrum yunnanense]